MKKLLTTILFLVFSITAYSGTIPATIYWSTGGNALKSSSIQGACDIWIANGFTSAGWTYSNYSVETLPLSGRCTATFANSGGQNQGTYSASVAPLPQCGVGFTFSDVGGSTTARYVCSGTCPAGTAENPTTHVCENLCAQYAGQTGEFQSNGSGAVPNSVCFPNNCSATVIDLLVTTVGGKSYGSGSAKYTGSACTGQTSTASLSNPANENPPPATSPETECVKQGKSFGTVNGTVTCVNAGTAGAPPLVKKDTSTSSSTETDSAGNTTTTGSTKTSEVSQDGQAVVTKTTETKEDGSSKVEEKTQSIDKFCEENPNSKICKNTDEKESKFTGSCMAAFVCEGDAVQCAMALKQHQTYCENTQSNTYSDIYNTAKSAADALTANGGSVLPNSTINLPTTIQGQKLLSSGGLQDITFPVSGQTIVLPLSRLSSALEFAGQMVLIISYLISAYILFGHKGAQ